MPKSYVIISSATAAALILGAVILTRPHNKQGTQNQSPVTTSTNSQSPQSSDSNATQKQSAATITYTDGGFSPSKVSVKSGDQVTVKNDSSQPVQFSSDPHPVHTANPELNQDMLEPSQSQSFIVTTKGTWGYHDHLNQTNTGTIVVE